MSVEGVRDHNIHVAHPLLPPYTPTHPPPLNMPLVPVSNNPSSYSVDLSSELLSPAYSSVDDTGTCRFVGTISIITTFSLLLFISSSGSPMFSFKLYSLDRYVIMQ